MYNNPYQTQMQDSQYGDLLNLMDPNSDMDSAVANRTYSSIKDAGYGLARGAGDIVQSEAWRRHLNPIALTRHALDFGEDLFRNTGTFLGNSVKTLTGTTKPTDGKGYWQYGWGKTPIADSLMDAVLPNFMSDYGDYGS